VPNRIGEAKATAGPFRRTQGGLFDCDAQRTRVFAQDDRGFLLWRSSLGVLGDEVDGAEDAGGDGLDFVEVLHLEAVAVFFYQGFVVVGWELGPGVEGGVVDVDFDVVLAGLEEF